MPTDVGFTAIYSKRDGIVDWRACVDPEAHPVEVTASHVGMALDPRVIDEVTAALRRQIDAVQYQRPADRLITTAQPALSSVVEQRP